MCGYKYDHSMDFQRIPHPKIADSKVGIYGNVSVQVCVVKLPSEKHTLVVSPVLYRVVVLN